MVSKWGVIVVGFYLINIYWVTKINKISLQNKKNTLNFISIVNTTIRKSGLTAVISQHGAELVSLRSDLGTEYIWDGNPKFWAKHSPVLFPIVGTLKNNEYCYKGNTFTLSRHGFARDMQFEVLLHKEDEVVFSLTANPSTLKVFPFQFELQIQYSFEAGALKIGYLVKNNNDFEMPFSIGAHPAFSLPGKFEDYSLAFNCQEQLESFSLENDLLSEKVTLLKPIDKKLPLNYKLFENDALVFKTIKSDAITILHKQKPLLQINFKDFPNLGIWTKQNAPFLCIEPWFGYADMVTTTGDILEKEGIIILEPQSNFSASFNIAAIIIG